MNRRKFLLGASSALTLSLGLEPAEALLLRRGLAPSGSTGFNGGLSQGQSISTFSTSQDFPFINILKQSGGWTGTDTSNSGAAIDPSWLASDGYPNQVGTFGVLQGVNFPSKATWLANSLGNLVLMWDVTGAGATDAWHVNLGNFAFTIVGTDTRSGTGNGTNFTCTFDPTNGYNNILPGGSASAQMSIVSLGGTAHVTNMRLCWAGNVTAMLAGEMFNPQFITQIKALKTGVWRFLDWMGSSSANVTTWATRKSLGYPTWFENEYRASLYPGDVMTNTSANNLDYQLSTSATPYTWPGFTSAPVDKQTMHVHFASNAVLVQNGESGSGDPTGTLSISGLGVGNTILFIWTSHPLSNGDPVSLNPNLHGGSPLQQTWPTQVLYVVNKATNTFQLATSPGGSAISTTSTSTNNNMIVTRLQTLNLNGNGAVPILSTGAQPFVRTSDLPLSKNGPNIKLYGTMVYDATFNAWLLTGASNGQSNGITSDVPPEVCLQLCKECGMYPHLSVPFMCLDTFTDYVPSLDAYIQANMPSWMIPHYEPANEVWNNATFVTQCAYGKAFAYFGTQFDADSWYGMALSIFGQAIKTSRGGTGLGTTYEVLCGMQTDGAGAPVNSSNNRTDATNWIAHGPARSPYTQQAASLTASAGLIATYVSPGYRGMLPEIELAWQYFNGASPGQAATLNTYADSLGIGTSGTSVLTIASPGVVHWPSHGRSIGDPILLGTTGALPSGASQGGGTGAGSFVQNIIDADHFTLSNSITNGVVGAAQNWTGTQSGTQYVSLGQFTNTYENIRYINWKTFFTSKSLSKMFAYEGGYSPDLFVALSDYTSPVSGTIANQNQPVVTLNYTNTDDGPHQCPGTPAQVGMAIALTGVGGMTQLNCLGGQGVTLTDASASITWTGNILIAGQIVMFQNNTNLLRTNITSLTPYYVVGTGTNFQISVTKGGSPKTISITGGGTVAATADSGWPVFAVSGNNVTLDVDTTSFGTYTSGGTASYVDSAGLVNAFRIAVLQSSPNLQTQLLANYNNYTAAGGLFPSQYGFFPQGPGALAESTWQAGNGDVWGSFNQQGLMIQAYN